LVALLQPGGIPVGVQWNPTSRQRQARYPDFLYAAPASTACAAFIKESRMKLVAPSTFHRKIRGYADFLYAAPASTACAAFIKQSRMKLVAHPPFTGNPWVWGTRVGGKARNLRDSISNALR
jgi:hypothetical protein